MPFDAAATALVLRPDRDPSDDLLNLDAIIARVSSLEFFDAPLPPRAVANLNERRVPAPYAGRQHRPPHAERRIVSPDPLEPIRRGSPVIDEIVRQPVRKSTPRERRSWRWWRDTGGVVAVEMALVLPLLITAGLGAVDIGRAMYSQARLADVAQAAAECWAKGACTDGASAEAWARGRAAAVMIGGATFTASTAACGKLVGVSYNWTPLGYVIPAMPLTSSGCAP